MVSVGFAAPGEVRALPSEMKRFLMSWVWPWVLVTPSRRLALILAVHILWVAGGTGPGTVRFAPTASYIFVI